MRRSEGGGGLFREMATAGLRSGGDQMGRSHVYHFTVSQSVSLRIIIIILPSASRFTEWSVLFGISNQN
jgi:hypothetical protein